MTFSLELSEDQTTVQSWVHTFAEEVIRPVASEWDEREETPWPVIQEAAKIGLYSSDFFATQFFACRSSAPRSPPPRWSPTRRPSSSASGSRRCSEMRTT